MVRIQLESKVPFASSEMDASPDEGPLAEGAVRRWMEECNSNNEILDAAALRWGTVPILVTVKNFVSKLT